MDKKSKGRTWLNSEEARRELKISSCDLSHIRESGKLRFRKEGGAFLYLKKDVAKYRKGQQE